MLSLSAIYDKIMANLEDHQKGKKNMLHENNTIEEVKNEVLYHVAKAAFEGTLDNFEATVPYEILQGY